MVWAAAAVGVLGSLGIAAARPWHDELYTLELARRPAGEILAALHADSGPPGYYLLCRLLHLAGADSVRALRILSLLGVVAGVALLVGAARRPAGRWAAAALLAAHPLLLAAAVEARPYGLLFATSAAAAALLPGRELTGRRAAGLSLALAAACWLHSLGLVLVLAVGAGAVLLDSRERLRAWGAVLAALLLHAPWFGVMAGQPPESLAWMLRGWEEVPRLYRWLGPLLEPSPVAYRGPFMPLAELPAPVVAVGLGAWLAVVAGSLRGADRRTGTFGVWWVVGGGVLVAATGLLRPVYAPGRAEVILVPAAVALVAAGRVAGARWGRVTLGFLLLGGIAACGLTLGVWRAAPPPPSEELVRVLAGRVQPGDTVLTTGWWLLGIRHGMGPVGEGLRWVTFPREVAGHPGWYVDSLGLTAGGEVRDLVRSLERELRAGHGVWVVRTPGLASDRLLDPLVGALGLEPVAASPPRWALFGRPARGGPDAPPVY